MSTHHSSGLSRHPSSAADAQPLDAGIVITVLLAMTAFAGNSILCRLALKGGHIDPASFTAIRIASGAFVLCCLARRSPIRIANDGNWAGAIALFLYAFAFSLAYISMDAGPGALILFAAVQLTMFAWAMAKGERLRLASAVGLLISIGGLVYLLLPGSAAPPLTSAALMTIAGVAWGWYSILGKGTADPLRTTAGNFLRAVPFAIGPLFAFLPNLKFDAMGASYALLSGAITSGVGYAIWYSAVKRLTMFKASTVQLSVPILTVLAGVVLLDEAMTLRIVLACIAVLGGVTLVLISKQRQAK